jgi:hypothetical protein
MSLPTNFFIGRGSKGAELLLVNDVMVFTSAKMHGALGPNKAMTDNYYPYNDDIMSYFGNQVYNGYQKFTIPNDGTYRFNVLASYPIVKPMIEYSLSQFGASQTYTDSSLWTLFQNSNTFGSPSYVTYSNQSGFAPGYLTVDKQLSEGDEIHILVGQGAFADSRAGTPSVAGSGASAIFFGPQGGWNNNFAVAGSVGGHRDSYDYTFDAVSRVAYSTTGNRGGTVSGNTFVSGSSAGSSGSAGYDSGQSTPVNNATSTNRSGGGAGLLGTARDNTYWDTRAPFFLVNAPTALISGGMGGFGGSAYMNPQDSTNVGTTYMTMYFQNGVPNFKTTHQTNVPDLDSNWSNYANNNTDTMPTNDLPLGTHMGGFGGGCTGGWGGEGGGGGYSGGGPGGNNSYISAGAGSSYSQGCTYIGHTSADASVHLKNKTHIAPVIQGQTLAHLDRGFFAGNGSVTMTRTA